MIDINELAYFAVVAEQGSITKAAKKLAMPKSTLSRRITRLEQRLDCRLLHRSTRQLKLTEAGGLYLERCRRLLEEALDAEQIIQNLQAEPTGLLRISTPLAFGTRFFQTLIQDFMQRYGELRIEVMMDDKPSDMIANNVDIAFHVGPLINSDLVARDIGLASWVFCATKEYLNRWGLPRQPKDLYAHSIIRHPSAPLILKVDGKSISLDVQSRLQINDKEMVRDMTLRHMGIGLVHTMLIEEELETGRLIALLADYPCLEQQVSLVYSSRAQLPAKTIAFTEFVLARVTPVAPWQKVFKNNPAANAK